MIPMTLVGLEVDTDGQMYLVLVEAAPPGHPDPANFWPTQSVRVKVSPTGVQRTPLPARPTGP